MKMESALIVSGSDKGRNFLQEFLRQNRYENISSADNAISAKQMVMERNFSICLINTPLKDEFGIALATDIAEREITQVMIIVKSDFYDEIASKAEPYGIFAMPKPISRQLFWSALNILSASYNKLILLSQKNKELEKKIEDIRLIDRSKCVLIEYLNMSEQQAHRYIEKQAMDMRLTKRDVAAKILKTYER